MIPAQRVPPRRRKILKALAGLLALPVTATTLLVGRARARHRLASITVPYPTRDGVSFVDDVILVRTGAKVTALSARCPHLGCRISTQEADELVCPCHGSRFSLSGERLQGPAATALILLELQRHTGPDGAEMADIELPR